jgi:hypothetical protein
MTSFRIVPGRVVRKLFLLYLSSAVGSLALDWNSKLSIRMVAGLLGIAMCIAEGRVHFVLAHQPCRPQYGVVQSGRFRWDRHPCASLCNKARETKYNFQLGYLDGTVS